MDQSQDQIRNHSQDQLRNHSQDQSPNAFRTLTSTVQHANPYWEYRLDRYELWNGNEADYWYAHTHGSVFVIARTDEQCFVLTEQMRYLNKRLSIEFPGGGLPKDVDPAEQARRELREETGYEATRWTKLGEFNPMNGLSDELCHVYLAEGLTLGTAQPDPTENIAVRLVDEAHINELCSTNKIWDGMTLAAWMLYKCGAGQRQ
ncbi:MAG: NUDIX domain-containing protein [Candidatus Kapaibacterium sp.]